MNQNASAMRSRHGLRLIVRNALLLVASLTLVAAGAEIWFRLQRPFQESSVETYFDPTAGSLLKPGSEMRWTNHLDFWAVSEVNSLGFLDREPISVERAEASCHVSFIGDSIVEARHVPIADKFHVRLEELARNEGLDVTTSAFGRSGTGQIAQLPYYEFVRRLRPKLLTLVFVGNDFRDNSRLLSALHRGWDPERLPHVTASRLADGTIDLHPPSADRANRVLPQLPQPTPETWKRLTQVSNFADWLERKRNLLAGEPVDRLQESADPQLVAWAEMLSQRPRYAGFLEGWQPTTQAKLTAMFRRRELPPYFERQLAFTEFALDRFQERARRDGFSLALLSTLPNRDDSFHRTRMNAMAEARGIPVIDHHDYVLRSGAEFEDTFWAHDRHWNPDGHLWAAEAMLEYLKANRQVCAGAEPVLERGEP